MTKKNQHKEKTNLNTAWQERHHQRHTTIWRDATNSYTVGLYTEKALLLSHYHLFGPQISPNKRTFCRQYWTSIRTPGIYQCTHGIERDKTSEWLNVATSPRYTHLRAFSSRFSPHLSYTQSIEPIPSRYRADNKTIPCKYPVNIDKNHNNKRCTQAVLFNII